MPVRLGLNVGGLLTAEITTASTLKTMSTRKAKLHMDVQAIIYLCIATMNQFTTRWVTRLRVRLPSSFIVADAARRLLVLRTIQPDPGFSLSQSNARRELSEINRSRGGDFTSALRAERFRC